MESNNVSIGSIQALIKAVVCIALVRSRSNMASDMRRVFQDTAISVSASAHPTARPPRGRRGNRRRRAVQGPPPPGRKGGLVAVSMAVVYGR